MEALRFDAFVDAAPDMVDELLRADTDVNRHIASFSGMFGDMRPLQWAMEFGMPAPLLCRLAGADVHRHSAALFAAAIEQYDDARAFELLVRRGARVRPEDASALLSRVQIGGGPDHIRH